MPQRKAPAWTSQEIAILRDVFPRDGIQGAADALSDRSWQAINVMASKLGIRSGRVGDAPKPKLQGAELEEAIRLREVDGWSFEKIGLRFGVAESAACNAVLIALCPRKGFTPAARDKHGRLTPAGLERVRLALKRGMKGVDIQLQLGVSASCVAEQRRRYRDDLKARGKAALPPPGAGTRYSGVPISKAVRAQIEDLLMQGFGAKKITERTTASNTSVGRIRNRLVKRLARKRQCLPGCDIHGRRIGAAKESVHFISDELRASFRARLLDRMPVRRAANELGIGGSSAYRMRDELAAELAAAGKALPPPLLPGRAIVAGAWLPRAKATRYRALSHEHGAAEAKRLILAEIEQERHDAAAAAAAERARPKTFEEQLARVAAGAALVNTVRLRRPDPSMTLGGIATGAL